MYKLHLQTNDINIYKTYPEISNEIHVLFDLIHHLRKIFVTAKNNSEKILETMIY